MLFNVMLSKCLLEKFSYMDLRSVQTGGILLANNFQRSIAGCYILRPFCMLLRIAGSCCAKFETGANNIGSSCVRWHVLLILTG